MVRPIATIITPIMALAIVAGCSAFGAGTVEEPTTLDGGSTTDANVVDGSNGDGSGPLDDGAPPPICNGQRVVVHEKFLDSSLPTPPFTKVTSSSAGDVSRATNGVDDSSPGSLRANASPNNFNVTAALEIEFSIPTLTRAVLSFSVYLAPNATKSSYGPGCVLFFDKQPASIANYTSIGMDVVGAAVDLDDHIRVNNNPPLDDLPGNPIGTLTAARWYPVKLDITDIDLDGKTANVGGSFDNMPIVLGRTLKMRDTVASLRLRCGLDYANGTEAFDVRVDDIDLVLCP